MAAERDDQDDRFVETKWRGRKVFRCTLCPAVRRLVSEIRDHVAAFHPPEAVLASALEPEPEPEQPEAMSEEPEGGEFA